MEAFLTGVPKVTLEHGHTRVWCCNRGNEACSTGGSVAQGIVTEVQRERKKEVLRMGLGEAPGPLRI